MKSATNRLAGVRYRPSGEPTCSNRPSFMMAIRSDMVSASDWSWVT